MFSAGQSVYFCESPRMQPIDRDQTLTRQSPPDPAGADPDLPLMAAIRAGDESAFSTLYTRYSGMVYALCLRMLQDAGQAEDCLVDIFWELWERRDRYDASRGRPLPHILGLARSRATDRLRSRQVLKRNEAARLEAGDNLPADSSQPLDDM